jgi:hypothetical protein
MSIQPHVSLESGNAPNTNIFFEPIHKTILDDTNVDTNYNTDFTEQVLVKNNELLRENALLLKRIEELETRLKKYTNGENHKRYYEKNKNKIKETGTAYLQKLKAENPDKLKEYSHNAYQRKKLKKQQEEEEKILQNMQ